MSIEVCNESCNPNVVYRRNDPKQIMLRQGLEGFSDKALEELEEDLFLYGSQGVASSLLQRLIVISGLVVDVCGYEDILPA